MTDDTKKQAKVKLQAIRNKIGYPDVWRDYSSLKSDAATCWAISCARMSSRLGERSRRSASRSTATSGA